MRKIFLVAFVAVLMGIYAEARALDYAQMQKLLVARVRESTLLNLIAIDPPNFVVTAEVENNLRFRGATPAVIAALRNANAAPLGIVTPAPQPQIVPVPQPQIVQVPAPQPQVIYTQPEPQIIYTQPEPLYVQTTPRVIYTTPPTYYRYPYHYYGARPTFGVNLNFGSNRYYRPAPPPRYYGTSRGGYSGRPGGQRRR